MNSISLLDLGLFRLSISSWATFGSFCLSRNWSTSFKLFIWWILPSIKGRNDTNSAQALSENWRGENTSQIIIWCQCYSNTKPEKDQLYMSKDAKILKRFYPSKWNTTHTHTQNKISLRSRACSMNAKWFNI